MIARLFYAQLPEWARPTHPVMRYVLGHREESRRRNWLRALLIVLVLAVAIGISYVFTASQTSADTPPYREFMYYPLVGATLLMELLAVALTTNVVSLERQKGTWDSLQITLVGAGTSIRARWALVFYRIRWLMFVVFLARLGYVGLLLNDMTDFEGRAIDVRIIGISPEISLEVAVFLLAALMTAAIMQPFVAVAFDAGVGLLVGSITKRRNFGILTTIMLLIARAGITLSAVVFGNQIVNGQGTTAEIIGMPTGEAWARVLFQATQGDLSLRILNLETLGNIWADLENGIYLGGIVLLAVVLQAILANLMVILAAHIASRPGKD